MRSGRSTVTSPAATAATNASVSSPAGVVVGGAAVVVVVVAGFAVVVEVVVVVRGGDDCPAFSNPRAMRMATIPTAIPPPDPAFCDDVVPIARGYAPPGSPPPS